MDADARELVEELIRRAGSIRQAAELSGVSDRHIQKWVAGYSSPSQGSLDRIRIALEGDGDASLRAMRIEEYARRVAQGESPFGDRRTG